MLRVADIAAIAIAPLALMRLAGVQFWTPFDTPDSEYYLA